MTSSLSLDKVLEIVRTIVDCNRCPICDRAEGGRSRYICGHSTCDECLTLAEGSGCILCITPPMNRNDNKPKSDEIFTRRAKNACNLLNSCEDVFKTDVYMRLRVSEQLKIEKEVFPDCIQAPLKYYNKRKSFNDNLSGKENTFHSINNNNIILPGELTSPSKKVNMRKANDIVQKWLGENEIHSRKALSDLNVNQTYSNRNNQDIINSRKRLHTSSPLKKESNKTFKRSNIKKSINIQEKNTHSYANQNENQKKICDLEESGIVIDDETLYIEDSQSHEMDKDKIALLAVADADNHQMTNEILLNTHIKSVPNNINEYNKNVVNIPSKKYEFGDSINKVPFYKKATLLETCPNCNENIDIKDHTSEDSKNVAISIENEIFFTTINISNCISIAKDKPSVLVQTDIIDIVGLKKMSTQEEQSISDLQEKKTELMKKQPLLSSPDIITGTVLKNPEKCMDTKCLPLVPNDPVCKNKYNEQLPKKSNVIICDSDSDTNSEETSILQVSADVHRSCDSMDYNILDEIHSGQLRSRPRKIVRGNTPDSSNSSDKENCDPNKRKKRKITKKKKCHKF